MHKRGKLQPKKKYLFRCIYFIEVVFLEIRNETDSEIKIDCDQEKTNDCSRRVRHVRSRTSDPLAIRGAATLKNRSIVRSIRGPHGASAFVSIFLVTR